MSERLSLLENLALKLGTLPGLGFLQDYAHNARAAKKGIDIKGEDKMNQVSLIREIGADAKKLVSRNPGKSKD